MVHLKIIVLLFLTVIVNSNAHITWIEAKYPLRGERSKPGTPWPLPNSYSTSDKQFSLDSENFFFESDAVDKCDIVKEAIKRYKTLTFIKNKKSLVDENVPILKKLNLKIEQPEICGWPQLNDDESYEIKIDMEKINDDNFDVTGFIQSKTVWGCLRGLETFSQMVYDKNMNESIFFYVNQTSIKDAPVYAYRGYMIDTSRHFLPVPTIMAHLNLMSFNKLNVLHWHVVDDQSWPLEMNIHTELHKNGAFSPRHVYNLTQVQDILNYARLLGIRVLPELDSPGHTFQIPKKYLTPCYAKRTSDIKTNQWSIQDILAQKVDRKEYGPAFTEYYGEHGQYEILNPSLDETFDYMLELFKEFKTIFKDDFIHLGMDEVYYSCWLSNPDIIEWMKSKNMTELHQIEQYYVEKTLQNIKQKVRNRKYQIWQDPLDNGVSIDKDAIIQIWKGGSDWVSMAKNTTAKGYQMVLSSPFYLNYIQYQNPNNDWEKYYNVDIQSFTDNPKEKELVIGAEVCVWSEFVDATNSISRTWPRASAPAERFWSNPSSYDIDSVRFRLDDFRCLMLKRGYPVGPILNGFCGDYEWDMLT